MKKALSVILALFLICGIFAGCGGNDTPSTDNTDSGITSSDIISSEDETSSEDTSSEDASSEDASSKEDETSSEDTSSSLTKPDTSSDMGNSELHVHSYNESVVASTCKEKGYTLYVCSCGDEYKANETPLAEHVYVAGVCSVCGKEDIADPAGVKTDGEYLGNFKAEGSALTAAYLQFDGEYVAFGDRYFSKEKTDPEQVVGITYKGTPYYSEGAGFNGSKYEIKDKEIVVYMPNESTEVMLKLNLLGGGALKVTYTNGKETQFAVGTTLEFGVKVVE